MNTDCLPTKRNRGIYELCRTLDWKAMSSPCGGIELALSKC